MNENIDLTKILMNCPVGTEFYHLVYNKVYFVGIDLEDSDYPIRLSKRKDYMSNITLTENGKHLKGFDGECMLFPSKEQRDWSKFTAPWYKKDKFDPKTLQPFDKVLACFTDQSIWCCGLFSCFVGHANLFRCCGDAYYKYCIPYNEETKHLLGTNDEPPEYYKFWEN